jgi:6-phosphogluconolactonase
MALRPHLPISVLLLGMGADMHTASLFPGADRLARRCPRAPLLMPMRAEGGRAARHPDRAGAARGVVTRIS